MDHTLKAIDEDLAAIARDIGAMGDLAVNQVRTAIEALAAHDVGLARRVVETDPRIDELEAAVERACVRFIALRQPVADDLRRVIVAMKTAANLERCGDMAKSIARRMSDLAPAPAPTDIEPIARLGRLVADRLEAVMAAHAAQDAAAATAVWEGDAEVDALHEEVFKGVLAGMADRTDGLGPATQLLFMAKNLERVGDHATNIAEMVRYGVTGQALHR